MSALVTYKWPFESIESKRKLIVRTYREVRKEERNKVHEGEKKGKKQEAREVPRDRYLNVVW